MFMRDIIIPYHPLFNKNSELAAYGMAHSDMFYVEKLVEHCLASIGGYNFVDEPFRDFDDLQNSDSKTVTVTNNGNNQRVLIIGSVENKIGSLRVTIFNPYANRIDYMYIPKHDVYRLKENDGTKGTANKQKERIRGYYSESYNDYNKLNCYLVKDFTTLATAMH
jgi:hypothetical protein